MASGSEVWKNVSKGTCVVYLEDNKGHYKDRAVRGGVQFSCTEEERQFNETRAIDTKNNAFRNGMLQPMKLVETAEDYEAIASNPNHIEEGEMAKLFTLPVAKFRARINQIDNVLAMDRIVEIAQDDATNAPMRLVKAALERQAELTPTIGAANESNDDDDFFGMSVKAVSPNS